MQLEEQEAVITDLRKKLAKETGVCVCVDVQIPRHDMSMNVDVRIAARVGLPGGVHIQRRPCRPLFVAGENCSLLHSLSCALLQLASPLCCGFGVALISSPPPPLWRLLCVKANGVCTRAFYLFFGAFNLRLFCTGTVGVTLPPLEIAWMFGTEQASTCSLCC